MFSEQEQSIIDHALTILSGAYMREDLLANNPESVKAFCQLQIGHLEHEVFAVLMLDTQLKLIKFVELFRGTVDAASVYPREVAKEVLFSNAKAVILAHNHPSGSVEPSEADKRITGRLVEVLGLLEVNVLDHIVCSKVSSFSFAEKGLL